MNSNLIFQISEAIVNYVIECRYSSEHTHTQDNIENIHKVEFTEGYQEDLSCSLCKLLL